jgi:hypothetical protein
MKRLGWPGSCDLENSNGHVTLTDGQGRVIGYVDPTTRIQTDIHGRMVRKVPVNARAGSAESRRPRRQSARNGEPDGQ